MNVRGKNVDWITKGNLGADLSHYWALKCKTMVKMKDDMQIKIIINVE